MGAVGRYGERPTPREPAVVLFDRLLRRLRRAMDDLFKRAGPLVPPFVRGGALRDDIGRGTFGGDGLPEPGMPVVVELVVDADALTFDNEPVSWVLVTATVGAAIAPGRFNFHDGFVTTDTVPAELAGRWLGVLARDERGVWRLAELRRSIR